MSKKKVKHPRKFFIKENDDLVVVGRKYFDSILTREDALGIGIRTFLELQDILKQNAVLGGEAYVGTIDLVDGFERTLNELEKRFPFIMQQIHNTEYRNYGMRVGKS